MRTAVPKTLMYRRNIIKLLLHASKYLTYLLNNTWHVPDNWLLRSCARLQWEAQPITHTPRIHTLIHTYICIHTHNQFSIRKWPNADNIPTNCQLDQRIVYPIHYTFASSRESLTKAEAHKLSLLIRHTYRQNPYGFTKTDTTIRCCALHWL